MSNATTVATEATNTQTVEAAVTSPVKDRSKERMLEEALDVLGQSRELNNGYAEAGPFYAAKAPVANSIGAELGVVTRDEKTGTVQRSGIGFYLRSDHLFGQTYSTMEVI